MKKTILALTIPALFATSVSAVEIYSDEEGSKIDLYGRLQYNMGGIDNADEVLNAAGTGFDRERKHFGGEGEARLGVNVNFNLNQDVDMIGKYEAEFASESSDDSIKARYSWLGFRFQDTTDLTFGKSESARAQLSDLTDTFDIFGANVATAGGKNRVDDQIRLAYAANGLDLRASYAFDDSRKDTNGLRDKNNQYAVSAGYTLPINLGFVASYSATQYSGDTGVLGRNDKDSDKEWGLGAHYTIDGFYFAGLYGQRDFKPKTGDTGGNRFWELQAAYNVEQWTLTANYANQKGRKDDSSGLAAAEQKVDEYTLGARYAFTPKTRVYAEYVINDVSGYDDNYGVGLQYNF